MWERESVCVCANMGLNRLYVSSWVEWTQFQPPRGFEPPPPTSNVFQGGADEKWRQTQIDLIRRKKTISSLFFVGTMVQQQRSFVPNGFGDFEMSYSHPTNVIYFGQHTIINCRIEKNEFYWTIILRKDKTLIEILWDVKVNIIWLILECWWLPLYK